VCRGKTDGLAAPQVAEAQCREDTGQRDSVSSFVDEGSPCGSLNRKTEHRTNSKNALTQTDTGKIFPYHPAWSLCDGHWGTVSTRPSKWHWTEAEFG